MSCGEDECIDHADALQETIDDQADEIERLKEENAKLREALESYLKTVNLLGHIANKLSEERQSLEPLIGKPPAVEGGSSIGAPITKPASTTRVW